MSDIPILMSTPMVRALLAGRKSQTRRFRSRARAGDFLWVRETWQESDSGPELYAADYESKEQAGVARWRPSIYMPRHASRFTLAVTDVRQEPLHAITGEDAIAEGIDPAPHRCGCERCAMTTTLCPATASSLIEAYARLWDAINGRKVPWASNPSVFRIAFRIVR